MNGRSVLCKQQENQAQIRIGVARHSIVGCTVYEARLSNHVKKIKRREENETNKKDDKVTVTETTAEIVCIVCKDGASSRPNEIVLCDKCGVGYHQKCHNPAIEDKALEPEEPWMCIFCSSGIECPYLLNPFETKLQEDLNSFSVAKSRENTKDNEHITKHNSGLIPTTSSRVRNLMANYYHDSYQRRTGIHTNNSHVRHVTGREHHVMSRRGMMERQEARHKFYRFPDEKSNQRIEQENADSLTRKRRLGQQRTSRDVWDNGYNNTSRDVTSNDITNGSVDDVNKLKAAGKEGPREKQRLTQDLEKQRKKLKEDMKRGQELQREHNQLLTRDATHDASRDVTHTARDHRLSSEDVPTDDDRRSYDGGDLTRKYDRRTYSHNGIAKYSDEVRNSSEKLARASIDFRSADDSSYKGKKFNVNSSGSDEDTELLKRKLDPCNCDDTVEGTEVNERLQKIPEMQCEHSNSQDMYHEDNDNVGYTREIHERANSEDTTGNIYSSEKIEVLGESSELNGYDEGNTEQRDKSNVKTVVSLERSGKKDQKLNEGKTNYEMNDYQSLRKERQRTKEGSNGRCGSMKTDKEAFKESLSGRKRSSCSDESLDNEHGGSKVTRNKPHIMNQDGGKKQHESKYESDITQNRVRSDLPRHNWLVERWINQKNVPTSSEKTHKTSSENFKDSKEATSTSTTLTRTPTSLSPVFEENYRDEVLDEGYTKRNSDDENINDNKNTSSQHETTILEVPFPVKYENEPILQNNPSPEIKYSPVRQEISPRSLNNCSPEIKQYSPTNRIPASPNRVAPSPNRVPSSTNLVSSSPNRVSASSSSVTTSPKQVSASPNRKAQSPSRIPTSPQLLPPTTNSIPSSPKLGPTSQNFQLPSANSTPISPNEKSITKTPPVVSQIEARQISSRYISKIDQELGATQEVSRTKWDTITSSEDNHEHVQQKKIVLRRTSSGNEEKKIIEVNSDGEESKRENFEKNKEVSKIQTGKSVNPVNPIVRTDKHVMDEMHSGIHEARHLSLKAMRAPAELPPGLPFMGSAYVPGYSPKTFTPHLITHNAPGMSATASPIMHHPGHPALQGRFPGRLDLPQHGKPDISCPFHGKKVEKIIPHVPGYPVIHGDAQMFPQHALLDGVHEDALKVPEKRPEHVEFQSDPLALQRRFSAAYDGHLVMPHGIHMPHPRYLPPGLIEEQEFTMDSERYKQKLKAAHAYTTAHKLQSHTPGGVAEEHKSTLRYVVSPSEEKRLALKYIDLPSQDKRNTQKEIAMHSESYRHHHREPSPRSMTSEAQRKDIIKRYNISPHDMRTAMRIDHVPRTHPESPMKAETYSPVAVRHVTTKENHPGFIQLGDEKPKPGTEHTSFKPSPSPSTLDRESISRDFNERFNILDKTFKEKLEGTDRSKDETIAAYRRHGLEVGSPTRTWGEHQARGVDTLKYRSLDKHSPHAKLSPPHPDEQRKLQERVSPRGLVTSSNLKPTVPIPSYRFHGGLVPSSLHSGFGRGMVGVPIMANHGEYAIWQGMRGGPARIPGYPPVSIGTTQTQGLPPEKNERIKADYTTTAKREYQEKELSLAIEKHRMNLAQLENERRKAFVKNERMDERRPATAEHERRSPRTREEEVRRKWEVEYRKRKLEEIHSEVQLSPHSRVPTQMDTNTRLIPDKPRHTPEELALRREQYIAMYGRQHDQYGHHAPAVSYPHRDRSASNPPFFPSRLDVQRGQAEQSVSEALRKQREYNERQEAIRKMVEQDRDVVTGTEPPKKRIKNHRCLCGVCGKDASFLCSGCQKAWYCSAKCQHAAWADHCKECTETKRR